MKFLFHECYASAGLSSSLDFVLLVVVYVGMTALSDEVC